MGCGRSPQTFSRLSTTSGVNVETLASAAFVARSLSSADSPPPAAPPTATRPPPPSSLALSRRSLALLFLRAAADCLALEMLLCSSLASSRARLYLVTTQD